MYVSYLTRYYWRVEPRFGLEALRAAYGGFNKKPRPQATAQGIYHLGTGETRPIGTVPKGSSIVVGRPLSGDQDIRASAAPS